MRMAREEYEEKKRRLESRAEEVRQELVRVRSVYDATCDELRNLRLEWRQQRQQERSTPHVAADRDAWGLKCTCEARDRFATWHNGRCDLFQKFPAGGYIPATNRTNEK